MLAAYVRSYQNGRLSAEYEIKPLQLAGYPDHPLKAVYKKVVQTSNPVCLFSSYVWNHNLNVKVAAHIKEISRGSLVIFGGPHVPKYKGDTEKFLRENPFIDVAVLGEGEAALAEILAAFSGPPGKKRDFSKLREVTGIVYFDGSEYIRTPERERIRDISEIPSPYLTGEFEPWFEGNFRSVLETNRGCPYGCTYCDWGSATLSKVSKFTSERVIAEIEYIASKGAEEIFIADANFGMLEQDIEIATALVEIRARTGYPVRITSNFAKNGGRRLMSVIKILHEGGLLPTGIIALQTTAPDVLKAIARDNIKTEAYEKMMTYFNAEKIPMASDLMIGLPGQTIDSFAVDLQFCFDWKVLAHANFTSMMPNAPMAEAGYLKEHNIVTSDDNMIHSTASFSAADMDYMKKLYTTYQFYVKFGVLKYVLYFLQIEHGVPAIKFLRTWLDCMLASDPDLPLSERIYNEVLNGAQHKDWAVLHWGENADFLFHAPEALYDEMFFFCEREFNVKPDPREVRTLTTAQQAVMPREGREYPYEVSLEHDIDAYVRQILTEPSVSALEGSLKKLSQWPEGKLVVEPDAGGSIKPDHFMADHAHSGQWELASSIRFY
ncbi:MAG: radical SAM protein [Halioglobus sp.]|nr:radical SAM protein [Halioglobus sp.]